MPRTPLHEIQLAAGGISANFGDWERIAVFGDPEAEAATAHESVSDIRVKLGRDAIQQTFPKPKWTSDQKSPFEITRVLNPNPEAVALRKTLPDHHFTTFDFFGSALADIDILFQEPGVKIAIVGAGVQGLCTAYYLAKDGCDVTVIDSESGPAMQTSMANGGILSYAMPAGWNAPGAAKMFFNALLKPSKAPIQFKWKALPGLVPWGLKFLSYANAKDFIRLTQANQRLAAYSQDCLEDILDTTSIECHHAEKGFLEIFENEQALQAHVIETKSIVSEPEKVKLLNSDQTVKYEPSLKPIRNKLAGAILLEAEKSADCYAFCQKMEAHLKTMGVTFYYDTDVRNISKNNENFIVESNQIEMTFDRVVIAAGNGSPAIAKALGVRLPMKPSKGFSFSLPTETMDIVPTGPIVDIGTKSGVNCFGGKTLRYVGGAEFAGMDRSTPKEYWRRAENFFNRVFPDFDVKPLLMEATPWVGFRPVCVDGMPIIGPTKIPGLFINTGHGALGWTFAAGSAKLISDQILGQNVQVNSIRSEDYVLERFG